MPQSHGSASAAQRAACVLDVCMDVSTGADNDQEGESKPIGQKIQFKFMVQVLRPRHVRLTSWKNIEFEFESRAALSLLHAV